MPVLKRPQVPAASLTSSLTDSSAVEAPQAPAPVVQEPKTIEDWIKAVHNKPYNRSMMVAAVNYLERLGFTRQRELEASPAYQDTAVLAWHDPAKDGKRHLVAIGKKYNDPNSMFMNLKSFDQDERRVKVKAWMTKDIDPDFWLAKWNTEKMPYRIMRGTILDETKGLYYMALHGAPEPHGFCPKCGQTLTHPVSVILGIGPKCGDHMWDARIAGFKTEEEAAAFLEQVKERMAQETWTGWVPKSSVQEFDKVSNWEAAR